MLVAHLFGGRADVTEIVAWAREHALLVVEDAAQAFTGPADLLDPRVDVALYSFGLIKTATAAGGALVGVRDPALLQRLRAPALHLAGAAPPQLRGPVAQGRRPAAAQPAGRLRRPRRGAADRSAARRTG